MAFGALVLSGCPGPGGSSGPTITAVSDLNNGADLSGDVSVSDDAPDTTPGKDEGNGADTDLPDGNDSGGPDTPDGNDNGGPDAPDTSDIIDPPDSFVCVAGTKKCVGDDVQVCDPGGVGWSTIVTCPQPGGCSDGSCCTSSCDGKACGDDGCGNSCGQCPTGIACSPEGQCDCTPQCENKACGDDGCGGVCGACSDGLDCLSGICVCLPDCDGKSCGDNGCGGVCGNCLPGEVCNAANACEQGVCVPECNGKTCGPDGCGTTCGSCVAGETCEVGNCEPVPNQCPSPVITVQEGEEVIPQTVLHLSGTQSTSNNGSVASYTWTVNQPPGSVGQFSPSASSATPTFTVGLAGTYVFTLAVVGPDGPVPGCPNATYTVIVLTDNAIHIELVWDTPNDPDQTDTGPEAGADLDLHLTHPFAASGPDLDGDGSPDPWFHSDYDCFWFNGGPDWGESDETSDDPSVDIDDTDGAGPEQTSLNVPETGLTYSVGVHYWNDNNFGQSFAIVRIYIFGALAAQFESGSVVDRDFWPVATIAWPSGTVTAITANGGGPLIAPNYPNPIFPN